MSSGKIITSSDGFKPHQEAAMLIKLQDTLEMMKSRVQYYGEKLAAIGDENEALKTENQKLWRVAVLAKEFVTQIKDDNAASIEDIDTLWAALKSLEQVLQ